AGLSAISGRNKLLGNVSEVRYEGLLAQVTIAIGNQSITSIITRDACEELGLKKGVRAFALIKATEVMVIRG
ncbi:MAG TPA: TOBE domain-containing protein, partial [Blastocatellia bacterium]|nr:TOBE domain-containing protein [Blastocatellia bacterium]